MPTEKDSLVKIIEEYRAAFFVKTNNYPTYIPLTPSEFEKLHFIIAQFLSQNKADADTYYYEGIEKDDGTILVWRGAEVYATEHAEIQRQSITNE